jgi:hypothetical protein
VRISSKSINRFVFAMKKVCVFFEVMAEFLYHSDERQDQRVNILYTDI